MWTEVLNDLPSLSAGPVLFGGVLSFSEGGPVDVRGPV